MLIREVENPSLRDLRRTAGSLIAHPEPSWNEVRWVGSGKGAIALVLKYLRQKGVLENKLSEILVPDWMGSWVYNQIQEFAFPVKKPSERTKAIFVYHQYGFPQDMDAIMDIARQKNWVVIEDCAHALGGSYKGKPLGSFGDFTIYSFSKFVFCFALGGVKSKYSDFDDFASRECGQSPRWECFLKDGIKGLHELNTGYGPAGLNAFFGSLTKMTYSIYGEALWPGPWGKKCAQLKISPEAAARQNNYGYFREQTASLEICQHLETDNVVPYIIPIRVPDSKREAVIGKLKQIGVASGLYNFDMQRNLLAPRFEPVVWVPCHGGISGNLFQLITKCVTEALN